MRNVFAIARREIGSYLVSPIAYLISAAFLLLVGLYFWLVLSVMVQYQQEPTMRYTIEFMIFVFVFAVPLITMRLLAQERRMGTLELLLTSPVQEWELVLGKFVGGLVLFLVMVGPTLLYPLTLELFGNPDWGPIWSGYLGLLLLGAILLSVGLLASALTQNQIVAAVLGVAGNLMLWFFFGIPAQISGTNSRTAGVLSMLDLQSRMESFLSGILDTRDVVYSVSMIAFFLFVTTRVLGARRWRT